MLRRISPANGYCFYFPKRPPGKRFVAGESVWVWPLEQWKHVKLGLFEVSLPGAQPLLLTTSEQLECNVRALFRIVIGGPEEGREERLGKATISCPAKRSVAEIDRVELAPFFRDWAVNYCVTAIVRTIKDCEYIRLLEEPEYRRNAERQIETFARETLAQIGMMLVQCTVVVDPREPTGVFATPDILEKWTAYKRTVNAAEITRIQIDSDQMHAKRVVGTEDANRAAELREAQTRRDAELRQETEIRERRLASEKKRIEGSIDIEEEQLANEKDRQISVIKDAIAARAQEAQEAKNAREYALKRQREELEEQETIASRRRERETLAHRQSVLAEERAVAEREVALLALRSQLSDAEIVVKRNQGAVLAENMRLEVLAKGAHETQMKEMLFRSLPEIVEHATRPLEKMGKINVLTISGVESNGKGGSSHIGQLFGAASTLPIVREVLGFVREFDRHSGDLGAVAEPSNAPSPTEFRRARAVDGV